MEEWEFEHLFAPQILRRGADYAREGRVRILGHSEEVCHAAVEGSAMYDVSIAFSEDMEMFCNCPYAQAGENCKHMAAVLYTLAREPESAPRPAAAAEEPPLAQMIEALDTQEVRALLLSCAQEDAALQSKILRLYRKITPTEGENSDAWATDLDELVREYADKDGFIDYDNAYCFFEALGEYMEDGLDSLLEDGRIGDAFELVCLVYMTGITQEADDSDGGLTELIAQCAGCWDEIYDCADAALREHMYDWFCDAITKKRCDIIGYLQAFVLEKFSETGFVRRSMAMLDAEMETASEWEWGELMQQRLDITPEEELPALLERYGDRPAVRRWKIKRATAQGALETAVELLQESMTLDAKEAGAVCRYREQLIDLYDKLSRREKYYETLKDYVLNQWQRDMGYIQRLKEATPPEQWPALRAQLAASNSLSNVRVEFLAAEAQWDALLALAQKGWSNELQRYEPELKRRYPEQMRQVWQNEARWRMERANDRRGYRSAIAALKQLRRCAEGRKAAQQLAAQWRAAYPRRMALHDELDRAGFEKEEPDTAPDGSET